jgi:hypothetical protein
MSKAYHMIYFRRQLQDLQSVLNTRKDIFTLDKGLPSVF